MQRILKFERKIAHNYDKEAIIAFYKIKTVPGLKDLLGTIIEDYTNILLK